MGEKSRKDKKEREMKKDEKYEGIKKNLENQKAALLAESGEIISGGLSPGVENFPDLTDQASVETDQNFTLRLREREQKLLKKIDEALERIANGTFGICESCGEEISLKRLEARPVTTLCIECKTRQEADEKIRES
jgi:DnaK suppressor protein